MRFEIVTIFPGFFSSIFENGILRRALAEGLVEVGIHDLRNFTHDRHRTVDDRPFGGGEGMVLKPEPIAEALASLGIKPKSTSTPPNQAHQACQDTTSKPRPGLSRRVPNAELNKVSASGVADKPDAADEPVGADKPDVLKEHDFSRAACGTESTSALAAEERSSGTPSETMTSSAACLALAKTRPTVILLSAQGRPFTQSLARDLAALDRVVLLCGRYEGVDERINQLYCDMELSIGDYVLSGGELAAAVVIDAAMRHIPGVLGNEASSEFESFGVPDADIATGTEGVPRSQHGSGGLLDYPHYTRPAEFAGLPAPVVLLNGDHLQIRRWRREQQLRKTLANRPDLLENATLSKEDRKFLESVSRGRA